MLRRFGVSGVPFAVRGSGLSGMRHFFVGVFAAVRSTSRAVGRFSRAAVCRSRLLRSVCRSPRYSIKRASKRLSHIDLVQA